MAKLLLAPKYHQIIEITKKKLQDGWVSLGVRQYHAPLLVKPKAKFPRWSHVESEEEP